MILYEPFPVGARFRVVPPGTPRSGDGRLDLVMARGAFGSGEHETTASCLELLEGLPALDGAEVLDLGAGTGILALAALALGAKHAVLVDNDASSVEAALRHCTLNKVGDRVSVIHGELCDLTASSFDLVLANIHGDILMRLGPDLVRRARPGAWLILSGILWEHNWDLRTLYGNLGCELVRNCFLEEYSSLLLRRSQIVP